MVGKPQTTQHPALAVEELRSPALSVGFFYLKTLRCLRCGRIERFHWFGSTTMTAFGVQMYGVELISPYRKYHNSAFVPVESISLQLAS
jgi:hypothetical protein